MKASIPTNIFHLSSLKSYGKDVFISKNVEIKHPHLISMKNHICIDSSFYITTRASLESYIHIGPQVCVIGGKRGILKMGNFTNIAAGSRIICGSDEFLGKGFSFPGLPEKYRDKLLIKAITINNFAAIGASVTVLPGITIGEGSVIGAGSLVTKDTKPWMIYYGVPAKPIRTRPKTTMLKLAKELGY